MAMNKNYLCPPRKSLFVVAVAAAGVLRADPMIDGWLTTYAGEYARIYATDADRDANHATTTWSRNSISQTLPAYAGIQEIDYSADWVYLRTSGLATHVMGPWYLDAARQTLFPNLPKNTATFYRLPRHPVAAATKTLTGLGVIGYFVDGVAMFDSRDGFVWTGSGESGGGTGYWNRDAYVNESVTFDAGNAHQPGDGTHHYHANPPALRYQLGDNVTYDPVAHTYRDNPGATNLQHSPILGWVRDGYPIYGPYGYANATNPASGVRRMISGYVLRDGANGTQNLAVTGRTNLPAWAVRAYQVSASQSGPAVSDAYPLGRYMEDNEYLGDLGRTQGADFDLDEYNGRYCMTPDFPNGTYAYFVSIKDDGTPVFPYNIGRAFYGNPTGAAVASPAETVTTNYVGGANSALKIATPEADQGEVTLVWSAVEGGSYVVESTTNLIDWKVAATNVAPQLNVGSINTPAATAASYRVIRTALAGYDGGGSGAAGGSAGILSIVPASGNRGTTVALTINLDSSANPPLPPQNAPINNVLVGSIAGSGNVHVSQTAVTSNLTLPAGAATGAQTVSVVFPGPPGNPSQTVTYYLTNGFTIN